jgi:hypothetical protein
LLIAVKIRELCLESQRILLSELNLPHDSNPDDSIIEEYLDDAILNNETDDNAQPEEHQSQTYKPFEKKNLTHISCKFCGKQYKKSYISTHLRTHQNVQKELKKFLCKTNKKYFKSKSMNQVYSLQAICVD